MRNISVKLFKILTSGSGKDNILRHLSSRALETPVLSLAKVFVQFW